VLVAAEDPYREYLQRFDAKVGVLDVGAYGKWNGRLIRKLAPTEFAAKYEELGALAGQYQKVITRGDTMNDALVKALRERQAELLLD
jgi:hypothetical protein